MKKLYFLLPFLMFLFLNSQSSAQVAPSNNTLYVDKNVSGGNGSGDSWSNALPELADALKWTRTQTDDNNGWTSSDPLKIYVAKGTYLPLYSADSANYTRDSGRYNAFVMVKNVQLYGGFDPDNGIKTLNDNRILPKDGGGTILSGDFGGNDNMTDLTTHGENAYHVIISAGDVENALVNGFTIRGGTANQDDTIRVNHEDVYQKYGGGVFANNSSPEFVHVAIKKNISKSQGAGIYNTEGADVILTHAKIDTNYAQSSGGGIYNNLSSPILTHVEIKGNISEGVGGGMRNWDHSNAVLHHVTITDNTSDGAGGGMHNEKNSDVKLTDVTISNNESGSSGGGMYNSDYSIITMDSVYVDNNKASSSVGGGIRNYDNSTMIFNHGTINNNTSGSSGGAIQSTECKKLVFHHIEINGNVAGTSAAGVYNIGKDDNNKVDVELKHVTIKNNKAKNGHGGGMYNAWAKVKMSDVRFIGNRTSDNGGAIYNNHESELTMDHISILRDTADDAAGGIYSTQSTKLTIDSIEVRETFAKGAGGAIRNNDNNYLKISKGIISDNKVTDYSGAGIYNKKSSIILDSVIIANNTPGSVAGGIYNLGEKGDSSTANLTHVIIKGNVATSSNGGGMYNSYAKVNMSDVRFINNYAPESGAGIYSNHGSIHHIDHVSFLRDTSGKWGSAIYATQESKVVMDSVDISYNQAESTGGAILVRTGGTLVMNRGIMRGNKSNTDVGGALYAISADVKITNSLISGSIAGGGNGGGAMYLNGGTVDLVNTTITGSNATGSGTANGGALYNKGGINLNIYNSIIYGNTADGTGDNIYNTGVGAVNVENSLIEGSGGSGAGWDTDFGDNKGDNIDTDPLFTDAGNGDYSLDENSLAVDGGDNSLYTSAGGDLENDLDLAGHARVYDYDNSGIIDMGAYEYQTVIGITPSSDNIVYVDKNISGGNENGNSWSNAVPELADALKWTRTQTDDNNGWTSSDPLKIYVAKGTYLPLYSADSANYTRDSARYNAFVMVKNVQLYGGFDPDNGIKTLNDNRILPKDGKGTILSGDLDGNDNMTDLSTHSENAYHVFISAGDVEDALVNGFTIRGGNADKDDTIRVNHEDVYQDYGGGVFAKNSSPQFVHVAIKKNISKSQGAGMYNTDGADVILTHAKIDTNYAQSSGGGIYDNMSSPVLTHVEISDNTSDGVGGGMRNYNGSNAVLHHVQITNNSADSHGGGMHNEKNSDVKLTDVTISGNESDGSGGGMYNSDHSIITMDSVYVDNNKAASVGGGIRNYDATVMIFNHGTVKDNDLTGGGTTGGGIRNTDSRSEISNVIISGNKSGSSGAGIYNEDSPLKLDSVIIENNTAATLAGGIRELGADTHHDTVQMNHVIIRGNIASGTSHGGGIYNGYATIHMKNVRILNNKSGGNGGGIYANHEGAFTMDSVTMDGNKADGSGGGLYFTQSTSLLADSVSFNNNESAGAGGAIRFNDGDDVTMTRAVLNNNISTGDVGGAIYAKSSDVTLRNALITNNKTGGGNGRGGAIYNSTSNVTTLINVTIYGNDAVTDGGALYNRGGADVDIYNSIIYGNTAGNNTISIYNTGAGTINVENSLVEGSGGSAGWNDDLGSDKGDNIDKDPLFTDAGSGDYSLKFTSPAINVGNNSLYTASGGDLNNDLDLAGNSRFLGGTIDMGAYEIFKIDYSNIEFKNDTLLYDENPHEIKVVNKPTGIDTITYTVKDTDDNNVSQPTDAGKYNITAHFKLTDGTVDKDSSVLLWIQKAPITGITYDDDKVIYDGNKHLLAISGNLPTGTSVTYSDSLIDAGVYMDTAYLAGGNNYENDTLKAELTIQKATITGVSYNDGQVTYDGNKHLLAISGNLPTGTSVTYSDSLTDAGVYTDTAYLAGGNNYENDTLKAILTIKKAVIAGVIFENQTIHYDGNDHSISVDVNSIPSGVSYSYGNNRIHSNVGTYKDTLYLDGQNNYRDTFLVAKMVITSKQIITGITFKDDTVTYNGSKQSLSISGTLPTGTSVTYSDSLIDAGVYTISAYLDGGSAYLDDTLKATLTIEKAKVTGVSLSGSTVTYDGNSHQLNITGTLPSGVSVSYSTNTDAGVYTDSAYIDGGGNYENDTLTATLTIEKAKVTGVSLSGSTVTYDGNSHQLSITGSLPSGVSVSYSTNTDAGTYTDSAYIDGGSNYKNDTLRATLIIKKATITGISLDDSTVAYDGNSHHLMISGTLPQGASVSYSNHTAIGVYTASAYIDGGNNYEDETLTATLTILQATISGISFNDASVVYDGDKHSLTISGNLPTGTSVTYSDTMVDAGVYKISAYIDGGSTVYANDTLKAELTIEKASQVITFNPPSILTLEDASDFQLTATSSSGLPITYSYTFDGNSPAAKVSNSGFVTLQHSGKITIKVDQVGNKNYKAAPSVEKDLLINSRDASIHDITIDGNVINSPMSDIHFKEDCGATKDQIAIEVNTENGAQVNTNHSFNIPTPKAGIYKKEVIISAQNGRNEHTYNVTIERPFAFDDIVVQKFNNTLLVNNNPSTNGGYQFVHYQWYKNGQPIAEGQVYSAGDSKNDLLEDGATYSVVLTTKDGEVIHTCPKKISIGRKMGISVYPNPVTSASGVQVEIAYPQKNFPGAIAEVYSLSGNHVLTVRMESKSKRIHLPVTLPAGIYIIVVDIDGHKKSTKFIVKP